MNGRQIAAFSLAFALAACASFNGYEKGRSGEKGKNWDEAVVQYTKALEIDPDNVRYQINLQRAKLEASRNHFEKGKTLRAAAVSAKGEQQLRLAPLGASEPELALRVHISNPYTGGH